MRRCYDGFTSFEAFNHSRILEPVTVTLSLIVTHAGRCFQEAHQDEGGYCDL